MDQATVYLTPQQVAERLQVRVDSIYRWIRQKALIAHKVGSLYRITEQQLEKFVEAGGRRRSR